MVYSVFNRQLVQFYNTKCGSIFNRQLVQFQLYSIKQCFIVILPSLQLRRLKQASEAFQYTLGTLFPIGILLYFLHLQHSDYLYALLFLTAITSQLIRSINGILSYTKTNEEDIPSAICLRPYSILCLSKCLLKMPYYYSPLRECLSLSTFFKTFW